MDGPLVSEVNQYFTDFAIQTFRLFHLSNHSSSLNQNQLIEISTTIGPLPTYIDLSSRFQTPIQNDGNIFTDENMFDVIPRHYNGSRPVGANYFPMTSYAYIQGKFL